MTRYCPRYINRVKINVSYFQLSLLNVLSFLIERMGVSIRSFLGELLQYLPALWEAAVDHNMLRCSILTTLVFIVQVRWNFSSILSLRFFPSTAS